MIKTYGSYAQMGNSLITSIKRYKKTVIFLILLGMGILYYLPRFMMTGIPHYLNEDTYFHLNRMIGMENAWKSPVSFLNYAHNGPAVNIFYPWLTMYPMYLFYKLTGSYILAYKIYYLILTVGTLFLACSVMKAISHDTVSSLIFSVTYTYSACRFINVFRRADLGESVSMAVMPVVLYGLYSIAYGEKEKWGYLALAMTLIVYSHNLSLLIIPMGIGLYFLLTIWFWKDRRDRILCLFKAAGTAVILSLGTLIPILQYSSNDRLYIPGASGSGLAKSAYGIGTIAVSSLRNEPVPYAVGFIVFAAAVWLIGSCAAGILSRKQTKHNRGIDAFALTGIIIFLAASSLLPWEKIGNTTPLSVLQFVWRLNSQSTIYILTAFCFYFPKTLHSAKTRYLAAGLILIIAAGLHVSAIYQLHREENTRILEEEIATGDAVSFDYAPAVSKEYRSLHGYTMDDVYINSVPYPAAYDVSGDGTVYTIVIDAPMSIDGTPPAADIPVFRYKNQQCTLNGAGVQTSLSERGTTLLDLRPGEKNVISVSYHHTRLTYISRILSFAFFILFVIMRKSRKKSDNLKVRNI